MRKKNLPLLSTLVIAWAAMPMLHTSVAKAAEPSAKPGELGAVDYAFVGQTFLGDQFEIDSGNVAVQRGSVAAVKSFAAEMVPTHEKVKAELVALLQKKAAVQPPMSLLEGTYAALVDGLKRADAGMVDRDYAKLQLGYQTVNKALFKWEIENGKDADLVAYAKKVLPEIENHLGRAKALVKD